MVGEEGEGGEKMFAIMTCISAERPPCLTSAMLYKHGRRWDRLTELFTAGMRFAMICRQSQTLVLLVPKWETGVVMVMMKVAMLMIKSIPVHTKQQLWLVQSNVILIIGNI